MIKKVLIMNRDGDMPNCAAIWVEAETEDDILKMVEAHNINEPIGRSVVNSDVEILGADFENFYDQFKLASYHNDKVWFEKDGTLQSVPVAERHKKLKEEKK